jgi:DNA polymerase III sliding clamp (beta) subunit (PCNA family)
VHEKRKASSDEEAQMKINRQQLLDALEAVRPGLAEKEIMVQTTAFMFHDKRVFTYNDQIAISHASPVDIEASVKSDEIYSLLKQMPDKEIDVKVTDSELLIKGGKRKAGFTLQTDSLNQSAFDKIAKEKTWTKLPDEFLPALKFVLFSAGSSVTKPELTCVHFTKSKLETCDSFRLTRYELSGKYAKELPVLIPASSCEALLKFSPTKHAIDDGWIHFANAAGAEFSCRIVGATFPDLSSFIDHKAAHTIEFPDEIRATLERADIFLSGDREALRYVCCDIKDTSLLVCAENSFGWFEEELQVKKHVGASMEFNINPQFLLDMLSVLQKISLNKERSIVKFEGKNFVHCCSSVTADEKDE